MENLSQAKIRYLDRQIHPMLRKILASDGSFERGSSLRSERHVAVCIPIRNEYPYFFKTVRSLYMSILESRLFLENNFVPVSLVCCVNAREDDGVEVRENNRQLIRELQRLQKTEFHDNDFFSMHILDCSRDGFYFSENDGVGLARKLALDYALASGAEIVASLDADCLVSTNYVFCLQKFYEAYKNKTAWAVTGFSHQRNESTSSEHKNAMDEYERYLFEHSRFLYEAGSPYYPVALGPTIVATSEAYVQCGGMNTKVAGEDFYFLQSLIKLDLKKRNDDYVFLACRVFPSERLSDRVLFGTGTALQEIMAGEKKGYSEDKYQTVAQFFSMFYATLDAFYADRDALGTDVRGNAPSKKDVSTLLDFETSVATSLENVHAFLLEDSFWNDWKKIVKTHWRRRENLTKAFFERFDGLKTIRLFNWLSEHSCRE